MAQYSYKVTYENNRGNKIVLTELPYSINIEPLLDYQWAYTTRDRRRGSRVAGFNKAVGSGELTIHVLGKTLQERNEAIDAFNNVIEVDIYDGKAGKIWFDDWYTYGYIVSSQNEKWQYDKGIIKKTINLVREEETWYHVIVKNSYSEIPDEDEDFEIGIKDYELSPYIHEVTETPDTTPYLFRPSSALTEDYDRALLDKVVGGTLAVNQYSPELTSTNWVNEGGVTSSYNNGTVTFSSTTANNGIRSVNTLNVVSGHKYFVCAKAYATTAYTIRVGSASASGINKSVTLTANAWTNIEYIAQGAENNQRYLFAYCTTAYSDVQLKGFMLIDLTQMLPSTIADYVYNLEQSTAGSGVAWLKQYYPSIFNSYQPYNAGSLESVEASAHVMTGFNQFDEEVEVGRINTSTGENQTATDRLRTKNYISVIPNTAYYLSCQSLLTAPPTSIYVYEYDKNYGFLGYVPGTNRIIDVPPNCRYLRFMLGSAYGMTFKNDVCVNVSSDRNGEYEPYTQTSYPLDSSLTLRGIPKLDNGVPYYDGDIYESGGTVTRVRGVLTNQTGAVGATITLTGFDTTKSVSTICSDVGWGDSFCTLSGNVITLTKALNNATIEYPLATPTTETADPYDRVQECYKGGTEEFVSGNVVPVGHETKYGLANLVGYDYDYDYGLDKVSQIEVTNPNPLGCNFVIAISGPVNDPYVKIGDTIVNVNVEVPDGGYLTVDSGAKTIVLTMPDGQQINAFGARNPDYYIFQLIESGLNPIVWDGSFSWQLQMIEERSEPRWLMG